MANEKILDFFANAKKRQIEGIVLIEITKYNYQITNKFQISKCDLL